MSTRRAHILLPEDIVAEIDSLVGPRGRSAFLTETARAELRRRKLLRILENSDPVWNDKNHPDLEEQGTTSRVRQLRAESENRGRRGH